MRVHAILVNWNGGDDNLACIRSLVLQGLEEGEIVFVDNGSVDGALDKCLEQYPGLRVVRNTGNEGFARGSNQGMEVALAGGAEYVFLVNNDVELAPGSLERLVDAMEKDSSIGVIGPRIVYRDNPEMIWCAGGRLSYRQNLTTLLGHRKPDGDEWRETKAVDFVPGCAMLIRRDVVARVGMFEEQLFAYHEDADLCLRIAQAGYRVVCLGEDLAFHNPHSSTGGGYNARRKYMMGVNSIWFLRRHGTPGRWAKFLFYDVLTLPPLFLLGLGRGRAKAVLAKGKGIVDGLRGRRVTAETVERGSRLLW